jgi:signal transduction histidine kinase
MVHVAGEKLKAAGTDIQVKLGEKIPPVTIDARYIGQALEHLLNNAAESMSSGGIVVVETGYDDARKMVFVNVIDHGKGIPDIHIKKVYQLYFTTKKGHKGIGLTVVRRVAEIHHGLLNIDTRQNAGTTLTLLIPVI